MQYDLQISFNIVTNITYYIVLCIYCMMYIIINLSIIVDNKIFDV